MYRILTVVLCAAFCCVGCVQTYIEPKSGPVSSIILETRDVGVKNLWFYHYVGGFDEYRCSATRAQGMAILNNASVITSYADRGKKSSSVKITVPAGKPFRIGVLYPTYKISNPMTLDLTLCQPHIRFTPEAGLQYRVIHALKGNVCELTVELVNGAGSSRAVPYEQLPMCYDSYNMPSLWEKDIKAEFEKHPSRYR